MRFCDLFISYKIKRKDIKNLIPFTKLPLYRKIAVITTLAILLLGCFFILCHRPHIAYIIFALGLFLLLVFLVIDSTKRNLNKMLQQHYSPYSNERMNMIIKLLAEYDIDISNQELIDLLITEARNSQKNVDYIAAIEKQLKILSTIIIPIIVYAAQKIGNTVSPDEIIIMSAQTIIIILVTYSLIITIGQLIREFLHRDYNLYEELISDLTQVKIFYSYKK